MPDPERMESHAATASAGSPTTVASADVAGLPVAQWVSLGGGGSPPSVEGSIAVPTAPATPERHAEAFTADAVTPIGIGEACDGAAGVLRACGAVASQCALARPEPLAAALASASVAHELQGAGSLASAAAAVTASALHPPSCDPDTMRHPPSHALPLAFYLFPRKFSSWEDLQDRALRFCAVLRLAVDVIALPDLPSVRDAWDVARAQWGYAPWQGAFYSVPCTAGGAADVDTMHEAAFDALERALASGAHHRGRHCSNGDHQEGWDNTSGLSTPLASCTSSGSSASAASAGGSCSGGSSDEDGGDSDDCASSGDEDGVAGEWERPTRFRAALGTNGNEAGSPAAWGAIVRAARPAADVLRSIDAGQGPLQAATTAPHGGWPAVVVPMFVTRPLLVCAAARGARVFGDAWSCIVQKEFLHPPAPSPGGAARCLPSTHPLARSHAAEACGLVRGADVPLGFRCASNDELVVAWDTLVVSMGVPARDVLLKPGSGASSGTGIRFGVTREQCAGYFAPPDSSPAGAVVSLEVRVPVAACPRSGSLLSPVLHFLGDEPVLPVSEQIVHGQATFGGNRGPIAPPAAVLGGPGTRGTEPTLRRAGCDQAEAEAEAHAAAAEPTSSYPLHSMRRAVASARALQRALRLSGFWGVDFLLTAGNMRPVLIDLNVGRPNGGHAPKMFLQLRAPLARAFLFYKQRVPAAVDVRVLWRRLRRSGLAFGHCTHPMPAAVQDRCGAAGLALVQQRGVALMSALAGQKSHIIVVGADAADVEALDTRWKEAFPGLVAS